MFPLNSKYPYIQENGTRSTLGDMIGSGGGGGSDLPEYDIGDAGKVLTVNDEGQLEWKESGGTTHITTLTSAAFPYTATSKGVLIISLWGASGSQQYYDNILLNNVRLLLTDTYSSSFSNKVAVITIPLNPGDVVSYDGNDVSHIKTANFITG